MTVKGNILYAELNSFTDKETGVVTEMTKICYTTEVDDSKNFVGCAVLEAYKPGNYLEELSAYTKSILHNGQTFKPLVDIELKEQYIKNGVKFVVERIGSFDFKKKK